MSRSVSRMLGGPLHARAWMARRLHGAGAAAVPVRCRDDLREPVVALTFDDGPSEWTEPILDLLGDVGARATFFVIGDAIAGNERILRRIRDEGHEIGNHTMTHPRLDRVSRRRIALELRRASAAVERVLGAPPSVFRPPGFGYNVAVLEEARAAGFERVFLASVATDDYLRETGAEIVDAILPRVAPGAIIDLHDGRPPHERETRPDRLPTVAAVELLLQALPQYELVTVSELVAR